MSTINSLAPEIEIINRLDEIIDGHYKIHKDSEYYASRLSLSLRVLNRMLYVNRNSTVYLELEGRVYREAKKLLVETHMSIKAIAYELGMYDPAYFCRRFRRLTGFRPSEYRLLNRS